MKSNPAIKYLLPCLGVLAAAVAQVAAADTISGEITPKGYYFDYTDSPYWLGRYTPQEGWAGDRDHGFYPDVDINLSVNDGTRDALTLERSSFGPYNQRNSVRANSDNIAVTGYYSAYRSASGNLDYLANPNRVPGGTDCNYYYTSASCLLGDPALLVAKPNTESGFFSRFNDDTNGQVEYKTDRTSYGAGMKFKPELLGGWGSVALNFDGYKREGNKFFTTALGKGYLRIADGAGGELTTNTSYTLERWRGMSQDIEENMNKVSLNVTATPGETLQLSYDAALERFDNRAKQYQHSDLGFPLSAAGLAAGDVFYRGFIGTSPSGSGNSAEYVRPLAFVPDSTLITQAIRLSTSFSATAVAAGYGMSRLQQDSFTAPQSAAGGYTGRIGTSNAYLNINHPLSAGIGTEAYIKYYSRDNNSSAAAAVVGSGTLDSTVILDRNISDRWGVRIAGIESVNLGLAATFSGLPAKSSLTPGWKHEYTDRNLQYNNITATPIGIWPTVSLYKEVTVSDEVYLKWTSRPVQGMTLRITPSYVYADKTGLVTEAGTSLNLKTAVAYAMSNSMNVDAYYHYKNRKNGNNSLTDTSKSSGISYLGNSYQQKASDTFHAAGIALNHAPSEWLNLGASLDWAQNDFETFFFGTNGRVFDSFVDFDQRGTTAYKVDTWSLSLTSDYQATDRLKLSAGYSLSKSDGDMDTASTSTSGAYLVSDKIDNTLHSLALGVEYSLQQMLTLRSSYTCDYYQDNSYSALGGTRHALMLGVSLRF